MIEEQKTKQCVKCKEYLPLESFSKCGNYRKDGTEYRRYCCRSCDSKASKAKAQLHKTAPPNPQNCMLCGKPEKIGRKGGLVLDHDHHTLKFRGWICDGCNKGLGFLGDNIEGLEKAILYLKESEK